jgi:ribonuclease HI
VTTADKAISTSSKLISDCMKTLDRLQTHTKVTINWTKAHVGYEGNEKADSLAKAGTSKINHSVEPIIPVPLTWIKGKIHKYLIKEWTDRWVSTNEARQTKIFFPEPNAKISEKLLAYSKQTCGKLFRWISGHSFHRYHNFVTNPGKFNSSTCRACNNEEEETSHLFAYCTGLAQIRIRKLGIQTLPIPLAWSPYQLTTMIREIDKICPEEGTFDNDQQHPGLDE